MNVAELHKRITRFVLEKTCENEIVWVKNDNDNFVATYNDYDLEISAAFLTHSPILRINGKEIKNPKYVELLNKIVVKGDPDYIIPIGFALKNDIGLSDIIE